MKTLTQLSHYKEGYPAIDRSNVAGALQHFQNINELKSFSDKKRRQSMIVRVEFFDVANETATSGGAYVTLQYAGANVLDATWQNLDNWTFILSNVTNSIDVAYLSDGDTVVRTNTATVQAVPIQQSYNTINIIEQYRTVNAVDSVLNSIKAYGNTSSGAKELYSKIETTIDDPTNTAHDGTVDMYVAIDGAVTKVVTIDKTGVDILAGSVKLDGIAIDSQGSLPVFYTAGTSQVAALTSSTTLADDDLILVELASGGFRKLRADKISSVSNVAKLDDATVTFVNSLYAGSINASAPSADTDVVFAAVNTSDATTFTVTGAGNVNATNVDVTGKYYVNGTQITTAALADTSYIVKTNQSNTLSGYLQTIERDTDLQLKLNNTGQASAFGYLGSNSTNAIMFHNNAGTLVGRIEQTGQAAFPFSTLTPMMYVEDANTKLYKDASNNLVFEDAVSGVNTLASILEAIESSGDVSAPASSTDNAVVRFNGTTGKALQNSAVTISDAGYVTGARYQIGSSATYMYKDASNNLTFVDANTGSKTLAALAAALQSTDINTTPVNGATTKVISSSWAYTHANATNPHNITKSTLGLADLENIKVSTWQGSSNITTLGTITTGVWHASTIAIAYGGTGQTTAQGAINALSAVSSAANETVLTKDTGSGNAVFKSLSVPANHITYSRVGSDLKSYSTSAPPWDFGAAGIIRHTMTANTTAAFTNYKLNKTVTVEITGEFTLDLSSTDFVQLKGSLPYDGTVKNWIVFTCVDDVTPVVLYTILQPA